MAGFVNSQSPVTVVEMRKTNVLVVLTVISDFHALMSLVE